MDIAIQTPVPCEFRIRGRFRSVGERFGRLHVSYGRAGQREFRLASTENV